MSYQEVILTLEAPLAIITLNNPGKINALSIQMVGELIDALTKVAEDEAIKVVILRAEGKHFCAGHYLKEMVGGGAREYKALFEHCGRMMTLIHSIPQPVIAQVQGVATAAGCQLVAWCDLAVAEEGARFATPGVKIGLFCTTPAVAVARAIGRKAAMEMLLTGRFFSAQEAEDLGLVNKVVPKEDLASETQALAQTIAQASRFVLALGKQAFYAQLDQTDDQAMAFAKQTMTLNLMARDAQHGITAFMEKKKPEWQNR